MSMDEQFEQMRYFHDALNAFTDRLRASVMDLEQKHAVVDPLWQDAFRKQYDLVWSSFEETMKQYLTREAPSYTQFLQDKLRDLHEYLYG
jgi:hypothetical protein